MPLLTKIKEDHFEASWPRPIHNKSKQSLAMESGNVFNLQDFEQNEVPFKQRSFEDSIDTFFSLFDTELLLIWMNTFRHGFLFHRASCPVLPIVLIISRGECTFSSKIPEKVNAETIKWHTPCENIMSSPCAL